MLETWPDWLVGDLKNMSAREAINQFLNFLSVVTSALMIWKALICCSGSESPVVVVLSGSMEPAFYRGDLLVLTNYRNTPVENGEIIVYKLADRDIPIVHRVIKRHENTVTGQVKYLTKGDNNQVDDRGLYTPGQKWIYKHEIIGRARGQCPYIGMVTIVLNDYPMVKYCTLAVIAGFMLIQRE